jgi:ABC-2 type transport system permease protein
VTPTAVRLAALIRKELQAVLGDKQSLRLLIMPVFMALLLFPFAATLEVKNNTIAVLDQDGGPAAIEIIERLSHTPAFDRVMRLDGQSEMERVIDDQEALLVLQFGRQFSEHARLGRPDPVQAIIDGRRSNSGQIALSYVQTILTGVPNGAALEPRAAPVAIRHWYNPNLDYYRFILPSLVALITTLSALIVTAMSVAREREQGTLDQLLVSPLTPWMIFVGKATPAVLVAMIQASIILSGSVFAYGVEFRGSLALLYLCIVPYVFALVGIGLFISTICATQQQAFLGVFLFVMPGVLLSGYVTPVDNMPKVLQTLTWGNPVRHFIVIAKGVYLKASILEDFSENLVALLAIGLITGTASLVLFQRRLS